MGTFSVGVDFGTDSVRALVVDTASGEEVATSLIPYRHGAEGAIVDDRDPNLARQRPGDYLEGFEDSVRSVISQARTRRGFDPRQEIGLGVDTTGSTPLPVDRSGVALALRDEFQDDPAAMAWLWKVHTAHAEAAGITENTCALGAAIFGAVVGGAHASVPDTQRATCGVTPTVYRPAPTHVETYRRLYKVYSQLHETFGVTGSSVALDLTMKELIVIRQAARGRRSS